MTIDHSDPHWPISVLEYIAQQPCTMAAERSRVDLPCAGTTDPIETWCMPCYAAGHLGYHETSSVAELCMVCHEPVRPSERAMTVFRRYHQECACGPSASEPSEYGLPKGGTPGDVEGVAPQDPSTLTELLGQAGAAARALPWNDDVEVLAEMIDRGIVEDGDKSRARAALTSIVGRFDRATHDQMAAVSSRVERELPPVIGLETEALDDERVVALGGRTASGPVPVPMILHCPECRARHVDVGEFASKPHHTHACQSCGFTWRPAVVPTVGVQFLPGFRDEPATTDVSEPEASAEAEHDDEGPSYEDGRRDGYAAAQEHLGKLSAALDEREAFKRQRDRLRSILADIDEAVQHYKAREERDPEQAMERVASALGRLDRTPGLVAVVGPSGLWASPELATSTDIDVENEPVTTDVDLPTDWGHGKACMCESCCEATEREAEGCERCDGCGVASRAVGPLLQHERLDGSTTRLCESCGARFERRKRRSGRRHPDGGGRC